MELSVEISRQIRPLSERVSYSYSEQVEIIGNRPTVSSEDEERAWSQLRQAESFYDNPKDAPFEPWEGTCRWVATTSEYRRWVLHERGFLSTSGSPGSGKSFLLPWMGSVGLIEETTTPISHSEKKRATTATSEQSLILYYSSPRQPIHNPVSRLLDSLFYNALRAVSSQAQRFLQEERPVSHESLIKSVIEIAKRRAVFWLIDGLDELLAELDKTDETPWLLPFLGMFMKEASAAGASLHICYTKRDYPVIKSSLLREGGNYGYFELRIDDHNRPDIERVLDHTIEYVSGKLEPQEVNQLKEGIVDRSGSGFAAAVAYVNALKLHHQFIDQLRIPPLPQVVGDMWHSILYQLNARELLRLVGFAITAQRPLTLWEFTCVSGFPFVDDIEEYNSALITRTVGLLRVSVIELGDDGLTPYVALAQTSLATYLDPGRDRLLEDFIGIREECHKSFIKEGLSALRQRFYDYQVKWRPVLPAYEGPILALNGDNNPKVEIPEELNDLSQEPMLKYAVQYLMAHIANIDSMDGAKRVFEALDSHSVGDETSNLLGYRPDIHHSVDGEASNLLSMWCHLHNCLHGSQVYGPGVTIWHILAQYNKLNHLAQFPREWNAAVETKNGQTLLHWAVYYNAKESANVILRRNLDDEFDARLKRALGNEPSASPIHASLEMVNRQEKQHGHTALQLAAAKGNIDLVTLLLNYVDWLRAKLYEALEAEGVDAGKIEMALGDHRFGINARSTRNFTALHYGAGSRCPEIVAALLNHGADWRSKNDDGESPLQLAIRITTQEISLDVETKEVVRILKAATFADIGLARILQSSTGLVDKNFHASKIQLNGSKLTSCKLPITQLLDNSHSILDDISECTWIHLPANNMTWAEILMLHILSHKGVKDPTASRDKIMRRELWTDRHTRGSPRSFISFMRPGCDSIILPDTIKDAMVLFMPYIHWETQEKQTKLEYFSLFKFIADLEPSMLHSFLSQLATENHELLRYPKTPPSLQRIHLTLNRYSTAVSDPKTNWRRLRDNFFRRKILSQCKESSSDLDLDLIELYASNEPTSHPLHPRRTLDQYFYYTLNNTSRRNQDQVVARYGRREGKKQPIVLMVDQLWLWRLDNVVVSCFPQRRECGKDDPDRYDTTDIFENILSSLAKSPINIPGKNRPMNLILRIIRECSSTFFDPTKNLDDDFKFLDIFNNSINRVADEEVNCYEQFIDTLKTSSHHHDRMPIDTEFYLLREIKDIIEELRMMRQVSDEQQAVLSSLGQKLSTLSQSSEEDPLKGAGALYNKGERYIAKIDRMQREAERTNNSINSLMDLRQRHATLSEAQATGRQGNTIMVFTVVTILFLPASFMASFFALPVAQFSRVQPDADIMDLTYIVRWLLVFTVPVAVFFISIAFYINEVLAFLSRVAAFLQKTETELTDGSMKGRISGIFRGREFPATSMRLAIDEDGQSMGDDTMSESKLGPDEESIWPVRHRKGFTIRYRRKRKPTSRPMSDEP